MLTITVIVVVFLALAYLCRPVQDHQSQPANELELVHCAISIIHDGKWRAVEVDALSEANIYNFLEWLTAQGYLVHMGDVSGDLYWRERREKLSRYSETLRAEAGDLFTWAEKTDDPIQREYYLVSGHNRLKMAEQAYNDSLKFIR